jgi:hypothetical protein
MCCAANKAHVRTQTTLRFVCTTQFQCQEHEMTHCCNTKQSASPPDKHVCPINGKSYSKVSLTTILHHLNEPWSQSLPDQSYYFCDDPQCDVVYFGADDSTIEKTSLRTVVSAKESDDESPVCYCFGINRQQSTNSPEARAFVIEQTKNHTCSCTTSNPSGTCCLKDFPK